MASQQQRGEAKCPVRSRTITGRDTSKVPSRNRILHSGNRLQRGFDVWQESSYT